MRLKTRMTILITTLALSISALTSAFFISSSWLEKKNAEIMILGKETIDTFDLMSDANVSFLLQLKEIKNILIRYQDAEALTKHKKNIETEGKNVQLFLKKGIEQTTMPNIKNALSAIQTQHALLEQKYQTELAKLDPANPSTIQDIDKALQNSDKQILSEFENASNLIDNVREKELNARVLFIANSQKKINLGLGLFALLSITSMISLLVLTNKRIFQQIGGEPDIVREIATEVAKGNLNILISASQKNSILYTLQIMRDQLRTLISTIQSHSISVSNSADELSASSEQLTVNISRQNDATSSMAAAVEEMTVSINHIAESAKEAAFATKASGESAYAGGSTIASTATKMQQIATSVAEAATTIATLGKQTQTISSITNVIKEVADQTNLLALNAAIEAARAGEEGRGFAVVADEVRNLAARTTQATSEISAMILNIQHEAKLAVARMDSTNLLVTEGVKLAGNAEHSIESIQSHVSEAIATIQQISDSLIEQSIVCQNIARKVEDVSQSSEESHSATINSSQQAQQLQSHSIELHDLINHFKV